ncbi:flagellar hook-basal body complex protein FliE [bacterium]|nr:flagellar hook-basal body complex protein FliE [bacterium]PIV76101.1 MAG: flagellar hook-basal body complex protein FliE [Rhodocyclales bacterium CG17_big_fil_post_rev_8_21_14_2_50_68_7]PJA75321.1 MAG: flagellar hook-basal body complex protein FliE [bacterium CG_4_9_14_3_um_filter_65_15]
MSIGSVKSLGSLDPRAIYGVGAKEQVKPDFAHKLQQAINEVGSLQDRREEMVTDMVAGGPTEVHDVMIAARESQLAFELMLETRNKLLEAYQEVMRMQV